MSLITADAAPVQVSEEAARLDRMYTSHGMSHLKLPNLPVELTPEQQAAATGAARKELGAASALGMAQHGTEGAEALLSAISGSYTAEQRAGWRGESEQVLRKLAIELDTPTSQLLADAARWLARGSRVAQLIKDGNLGDNPRIVEIAAKCGHALRHRAY